MSLFRSRRYRVVLSGTNILIHAEGRHDPIVGFEAVRFVRAGSPEEAALIAQARVRGAWFMSPYSTANRACGPAIRVTLVERVRNPFRLSRPNRGYHFIHDPLATEPAGEADPKGTPA